MNNQAQLIASIAGRRAPQNFHSHVIRALGVGIVSGRYPELGVLPGDSELQKAFGVSRTVLREALKTLSAKGLIEARAKIGTRVRPRAQWNLFDLDVLAWHFEAGPDLGFIGSLAEMRHAIEPEAAAHAALRRSPEQAAAIIQWAERMADEGNTAEAFARYDLEFHRAVADASHNPFMRSISALVELALSVVFTLSSPTNDRSEQKRIVGIHREIADAIEASDAETARRAMHNAITVGYDRAHDALIARG